MSVAELQLRRGASVGLLVGADQRPAAFVKTHAEDAYFARERAGLALANRVLTPLVRAPRLLEADVPERRLVMEHVAGTPLRRAWRRRCHALNDDDARLAAALGGWLAQHHAVGVGPPDPSLAGAKAEAAIDALGRAGRWLGARRRDAAICLARRLGEEIAADGRPSAACHGDFTLGNVLAVDGGARVIDFGSAGRGLGETDMAAFRASLHTTLGALPGGGAAADRLWAAFLAGYGPGWSPAALDLCELYVLAHSVAEPFDFPPPAPPKRLWETYVLLRNVLRLRQWVDNRGCPPYV